METSSIFGKHLSDLLSEGQFYLLICAYESYIMDSRTEEYITGGGPGGSSIACSNKPLTIGRRLFVLRGGADGLI